MVLVGYGINDNKLRVREKVEWMVVHSDYKSSSSETTSDKESVIVRSVISVYFLRKKRKIKTVSVKTVQCQSSKYSLAHWYLGVT